MIMKHPQKMPLCTSRLRGAVRDSLEFVQSPFCAPISWKNDRRRRVAVLNLFMVRSSASRAHFHVSHAGKQMFGHLGRLLLTIILQVLLVVLSRSYEFFDERFATSSFFEDSGINLTSFHACPSVRS